MKDDNDSCSGGSVDLTSLESPQDQVPTSSLRNRKLEAGIAPAQGPRGSERHLARSASGRVILGGKSRRFRNARVPYVERLRGPSGLDLGSLRSDKQAYQAKRGAGRVINAPLILRRGSGRDQLDELCLAAFLSRDPSQLPSRPCDPWVLPSGMDSGWLDRVITSSD